MIAYLAVVAFGLGMLWLGRWYERDGRWAQRWRCPGCGVVVRSNQRTPIEQVKAIHSEHVADG